MERKYSKILSLIIIAVIGFVPIPINAITETSSSALFTWGTNYYAQLGNGTTSENIPVQIGTAEDWKSVSAGAWHNMAIKSDGTLWTWGYNNYGQLGDSTTDNKNAPTQIGSESDWSVIAAGDYHSLAIKSDGTLWAWGYNLKGQLGDGTTTNKTSPILIGTGFVSVSAEYTQSFAIKNDGTLWAWGNNTYGLLGDGTTTDRTSPAKIGTDTDWAKVTAGFHHTLAIKSTGTLWGWGDNGLGQLGIFSLIGTRIPVQIGTDTNWTSATAGGWHSLALKNNGTLWAWGDNDYGELGIGLTVARRTPIQIGTDTNWAAVSAAGEHSLAIKCNGTLWAWGRNIESQLGDGSTTARTSPVQIGEGRIWTDTAIGWFHCLALGNGYINNVAPDLGLISVDSNLKKVGESISASAVFTDPNSADTHIGIWDWSDTTQSNAIIDPVTKTVIGGHIFNTPGVYEIILNVADNDGASDRSTYQYVVVYDPSGGFATGGGWIMSPAGAYVINPTLSGKANFGFVSKYQKGASIPTGNTEFQFNVGDLSFKSTAYQWLVVAGAKAQYKGTGTINGSGEYGFMLTAIDGQINGGGGLDKFRIKIWEIGGGLVYDNLMGVTEDANPTSVVGGGSIVIHS